VTGLNQSVVQNLDYLPYGELNSIDSGITTHEFTGDEHDAETDLAHTLFRQYSSSLGRWMTPDPAGLAVVDPTDPQSWNRYAYVTNDPIDLIDPLGLCGGGPGNVSIKINGNPAGSQDFTSPACTPDGGWSFVMPCQGFYSLYTPRCGPIPPPPLPIMHAPPPKPTLHHCKLLDVLRASVDSGLGVGFELKAGVASAGVGWWRSAVDNATHADVSMKLLTIGFEGSTKDPGGDLFNPSDLLTSTNEIKYGPYRYNVDTGQWHRANTTLSKDLFKSKYGGTFGFFRTELDAAKAEKYISDHGCDIVDTW